MDDVKLVLMLGKMHIKERILISFFKIFFFSLKILFKDFGVNSVMYLGFFVQL